MKASRLCVFILLMLGASGAALSQTVAQTAKLPENEQRAIVTGFVDNSFKNLASHTDRSGKTKSAAQYELDRALANFARAFFTRDATHPNDAPPGLDAILHRIKKEAATTPDRTVADAMGDLVDPAFAHFYTDFYTADKKADFAKKTDADQVEMFRLNIEVYQTHRANQQVIKKLQDQDNAVLAKLKGMYDNSVILADGRHTLRASNGDFMVVPEDPDDRSEVKLEGVYRDEAQRLYDCMNAHGISNGLKGREVCAEPASPVQSPAATLASRDAQDAKDRMLQAVREDVSAYIEASKTGFEAYKSGEAKVSQGNRIWNSRVKPLLAHGCWVIQGAATATFSCLIPQNPDLNAARAFYAQITEDVTASLPGDWSADAAAPFTGDLPSKGYRSSSGAHGEVWLAGALAGNGYELHYQLVSAPLAPAVKPPPAKPFDDDPIGEGGFITPPTR